ncbi:MAG: tetratricopeptide repeat protein [Nitrospinota bacterium]|nr:tetratricopeptide repeat protein [Nitrospinota bacterium]
MFFNIKYFHYKKLLFYCIILVSLVWVNVTSAYEVNKNAVALIIAKNKAGKTVGTGSGFIVKPEGTLLTNYHVLVDAHSVKVHLPNGTKAEVKEIYKIDRIKDFAILKLEEGLYSTLELGDSTKLKDYDYTSALGYLSENVRETSGTAKGIIEQTYGFVLGIHSQALPGIPFIYSTTEFGPGFSGGPVVDKSNKVVGIATIEGHSMNLSIPIQYIKPFLHETNTFDFNELLRQDKTSKEAMYYRGNFYLHGLSEPNKAINEFKKILELDPNFTLAHYDLAVAYRHIGKEEEAILQYEKTIELQPNFPEALSNLGGYYFRTGKVEQAKNLFKKAIAIYPNFIHALSNLGAVLNKLGKPGEAIPYLKKTLSLDPEFAIASFNLGNSQFALKRFEEAQKSFERSANMGLDFLSMHWKLYEIHLRKKAYKRVEKELQIILEMDPLNEKAGKKLSELPKLH